VGAEELRIVFHERKVRDGNVIFSRFRGAELGPFNLLGCRQIGGVVKSGISGRLSPKRRA
jgi:hypothetical protein